MTFMVFRTLIYVYAKVSFYEKYEAAEKSAYRPLKVN